MMISNRSPRALFACGLYAIGLACAAELAGAQAPVPNVNGHWVGVFDVVHADSSVEPDTAYFFLTRTGSSITGSAGDSRAHQSPITSGSIEGGHLRFAIAAGPNKTVQFDLAVEPGRLQGSASGLPAEPGSSIIVDVRSADADWHASVAANHVPDRLFETIAALDKKLFDAYNNCDLETMGTLVTDDLEFYHDKTGLAIGKKTFLDSIQDNICGKVRRELTAGTMEVHRLAHFGAVEMGVHRFYHPHNPEDGIGEAKFISVWRFQNGSWQITREISYDHQSAAEATPAAQH
jgi:ketosteroid isomerase-like protein